MVDRLANRVIIVTIWKLIGKYHALELKKSYTSNNNRIYDRCSKLLLPRNATNYYASS